MNESNTDMAPQLSDPEVEQLLGDAFQAPTMPRSLLKRIDHAVEQEWGTSPRLADTKATKVTRTISRSARWVKTLPIAAALSILVGLAVVFLPQGSGAYGWADLVEALREQAVVVIEASGQSRWMAPEQGLVASMSDASAELINLNDGVYLRRASGDAEVGRRAFHMTSAGSRQDLLVLSLLLGETGSSMSKKFLETARVADERSDVVSLDGVAHVQLDVRFEAPDFQPVSLRVLINSESRLPTSCNVTGWNNTNENLAFNYPSTDVDQLLAKSFPADLPRTDLSGPDLLPGELPHETKLAKDQVAMKEATVAEIAAVDAALAVPDLTEPVRGVGLADIPPAEWQAVAVVDRTGEQVTQKINNVLTSLWQEHKVTPTDSATDEELLRRVYLDVAGRTPGVNEVRSYLNDNSPERYSVLVDRLLQSRDHATHLAAMFRMFLIPESVDLTAFGGVETFDKWLAEQFESNTPYDEIVKSLVQAEGRLSRSGPLLFYSANKLDADQLAARTARVFLGTRLECAQCHDHPFEPWAQEDFWGFAAFFARISRPQGTLEAASTVMQVRDVDHGEVTMPESETVVPPKYLNASEPLKDTDPSARRRLLAEWMTSDGNPYFARATANRVWAQLFGKGIVEPLDDFGMEHPARSAALLDTLAGHLIHSDFSIRELFRAVVMSNAYRLSSAAATLDEQRLAWFAQMNVKTLTAEQVYDCITMATLTSADPALNASGGIIVRYDNTARDSFLQQFRTPTGRQTEYMGGIPQALTLMNGGLIDGVTGLSSSGLLKSLEAPFFTNEQRIEVLYFSTLSRRPTDAEWEMLDGYVGADAKGAELRESLSDILWALLNSAEFTMNH